MPLGIIFARDDASVEDNAKRYAKALDAPNYVDLYDPRPIGIPHYLAIQPLICGDCGENYWAKYSDQTHRGCKGEVRGTGF